MREYESYTREEKQRLIDYWIEYIDELEIDLNSSNPSESKWVLEDKIKEAKRDIDRLKD